MGFFDQRGSLYILTLSEGKYSYNNSDYTHKNWKQVISTSSELIWFYLGDGGRSSPNTITDLATLVGTAWSSGKYQIQTSLLRGVCSIGSRNPPKADSPGSGTFLQYLSDFTVKCFSKFQLTRSLIHFIATVFWSVTVQPRKESDPDFHQSPYKHWKATIWCPVRLLFSALFVHACHVLQHALVPCVPCLAYYSNIKHPWPLPSKKLYLSICQNYTTT